MTFRYRFKLYALSASLAGCAALLPSRHAAAQPQAQATPNWLGESGIASYYGRLFHGRRTAAGARFDQQALTAAHPWLPFGTRVRVTLEKTGHSVVVVINDRLAASDRIIDLSVAAARRLGMLGAGTALVSLSPL